MVWIPGGMFDMGSEGEHAAPAERPKHTVTVDGFFIDARLVTNAEFREFVRATKYVTVAERAVDREQLLRQMPPGTPPPAPEMLVPGSLVFAPTGHAVSLDDWSRWWKWMPGANWQHPTGPESTIEGQDNLPVVQIAWEDAMAYAKWAGRRLPTEAEWEFAARGGLKDAEYAWGNEDLDSAHPQAHIYAGDFPTHAAAPKPVGSFAANGFGLFDMSGNVWQWTADWYWPDSYARDRARGVVRNPAGPDGPDPRPGSMAARVLRGGSFLCNDVYCRGYRVSARSSAAPDSGASHIGFRTVMTVEQWTQHKRAGGAH
jgi:formylglycine-generating enzyme required for sulfatase activity